MTLPFSISNLSPLAPSGSSLAVTKSGLHTPVPLKFLRSVRKLDQPRIAKIIPHGTDAWTSRTMWMR